MTGPILPAEKTITIGANRVTVPQYYYKVIGDTAPPEKMIAFVLPSQGCSSDLRTFAVTVDRVEELTGLDFISTVPQPKQEPLERTITAENQIPAEFLQLFFCLSRHPIEFFLPEFDIFGQCRCLTASGTPMPEAFSDFSRRLVFRQDDIRMSGKRLRAEPEAEAPPGYMMNWSPMSLKRAAG